MKFFILNYFIQFTLVQRSYTIDGRLSSCSWLIVYVVYILVHVMKTWWHENDNLEYSNECDQSCKNYPSRCSKRDMNKIIKVETLCSTSVYVIFHFLELICFFEWLSKTSSSSSFKKFKNFCPRTVHRTFSSYSWPRKSSTWDVSSYCGGLVWIQNFRIKFYNKVFNRKLAETAKLRGSTIGRTSTLGNFYLW